MKSFSCTNNVDPVKGLYFEYFGIANKQYDIALSY